MSQKRENRPLLIASETIERRLLLLDARVHDAIKTDLPDTPSADDLGLAEAIDSAIISIETNGGGTASTIAYALWRLILDPLSYDAGKDVTIRIRAKTTALGEVDATLDLEAKLLDEDGDVGADLVSTAKKDLTTAYVDYDFVIAGATLVPGGEVQLRAVLDRDDTGGTAAGTMSIVSVSVMHTAPDIDAL